MDTLRKLLVPGMIVALLVAFAVSTLGGEERKTFTAKFPRAISVFEGSDVRVLGVAVGTVDKVTPSGTDVEVEMSYDADVKIPADAGAVIVAPSIVGDRFVQLTPVYTSGPVLKDGAVLDTDKTSMPLELDEVYSSLNDLNVALGPTGANRTGALSDLLSVTADNFGGQGRGLPRDDRAVRPVQHDPGQQPRRALRHRRQAAVVPRDARRQRHDGAAVQPLPGPDLRAPRRGAPGAGRGPGQPGHRDEDGVGVREGEPGDPRAQHQRAEPCLQGAGQAAEPRWTRSSRWRRWP